MEFFTFEWVTNPEIWASLVTLIARGYRLLAYALIAVYVVPLLTFGLWQLRRGALAAPPA